MNENRVHNPAAKEYYAIREKMNAPGIRGWSFRLRRKFSKEHSIAREIKSKYGEAIKKLGST